MPDVGEQHGEMAKAQSLLLGGQAQFGDGPDQRIDHRIQETQQFVSAFQLFWSLRGARAQTCEKQHSYVSLLRPLILF